MFNSTIRLVLWLGILLLSSVAALAEPSGAIPDWAKPDPASKSVEPPAKPDSASKTPDPTPIQNSRFSIIPDPKTKWQPRGGTTHFTLTGKEPLPVDVKIMVCF